MCVFNIGTIEFTIARSMQTNDEFFAVIYSTNYPEAFGSYPIKRSDQMCFWQDF